MRHTFGPKLSAVHKIIRRHGTSSTMHTTNESTPEPTGSVGHSGMSPDGPTEIHVHLYHPNASGLSQGGMSENEGGY
jgi:hypothetical protein